MKIAIAYVPVLHSDYIQFFSDCKREAVQELYVLGKDVIEEFEGTRKDLIRALEPYLVKFAVDSFRIFPIETELASIGLLQKLNGSQPEIIMPDEDVSRAVAKKYLNNCSVKFRKCFLRWDKQRTLAQTEVNADRETPLEGLTLEMMGLASQESIKASDWWRQVGAVAARSGEVLISAYNRHVPHPLMPYAFGSPRSNFKKGVFIELTTDFHAEAGVIAQAARSNVSLEGADLYVTTFPCPPCAKLVAHSGIRRVFFKEGYAMLDGESILKAQGVEIIRVKK